MDGFLNVYKEQGYTSFDVVARLRGILKQKKIGHTGTLDPMAEGVLLVCLGNATKMCDLLTEKNKKYKCVMLLGKTTDTEDATGNVLSTSESIPAEAKIRDVINSFICTYDQIPPMYSAIKVNGKKLYEYAREGIEIERAPRSVTIYDISIEDICIPRVSFTVGCSKGTYIRSLCRDIGEALGCGGIMEKLIRTEVKDFNVKDSLTLKEIEDARNNGILDKIIMPTDLLVSDLPALHIAGDERSIRLLKNGNKLNPENFAENKIICDTNIRIYDNNGSFTALYFYDKNKRQYVPYKIM